MILGVESSCDESALAIFDPDSGFPYERIHSQTELHATYGGVVPDLASREHLQHFPILLADLVKHWNADNITSIAVTRGPGLAACLATGITLAKAIAIYLGKPLVGVNHLQGHAYSPFIPLHAANRNTFQQALDALLPHLGLVVSGGNTIAVKIDKDLSIRTLAETVDDAAGEAIDKGAKLLGLPYPGGPALEALARRGQPDEHVFPVSFPSPEDHRFSFSGLKTSLRYTLERMDDATLARRMPNLCHSYQHAVIEQLIRKTGHLLDAGHYQSAGLSGGVSNNSLLRSRFEKLGKRHGVPVLLAERRHTGDNASMIAFCAWINPAIQLADTPDHPLGFSASLRIDSTP